MKKIITASFALLLAFSLAACSSTPSIQESDDEKVEPKVNSEETSSKEEVDVDSKVKEEDVWTYYEDATHEDTWEGLTTKIEKVVVSDKAPGFDDEQNEIETSAVGIKFTIENTTEDKIYTTYPDQATLVTSTGEQIEADMFLSDHLGGEIHEGVVKQGDVFFYLERGAASEIEWVKLEWSSSYDDPEGNYDNDLYNDHSVKLQLK